MKKQKQQNQWHFFYHKPTKNQRPVTSLITVETQTLNSITARACILLYDYLWNIKAKPTYIEINDTTTDTCLLMSTSPVTKRTTAQFFGTQWYWRKLLVQLMWNASTTVCSKRDTVWFIHVNSAWVDELTCSYQQWTLRDQACLPCKMNVKPLEDRSLQTLQETHVKTLEQHKK